jgi:hypothetical protein
MLKMKVVFLLWHSHDLGDNETDDKLIGAYSSETEAEAAKARTVQNVGFRDQPDGFHISGYELNRDHWTEGYVTVTAPPGVSDEI